ncbi:hypothetical protein GOBAR_AA24580 [Gossypium barbadense]|uniref:SAP domain-containing protein n=1 Tax=Gossypium barbadense TaxID=3634 RepID=A0A2P5WYE1_GOSBA|nr:hypothetical protein GOBAR_AA24580 [Gossypium barbadense]
MGLDPEDVFKDEEDDPDNEFFQQSESSKEYVVYLVDASPKMFNTTCPGNDQKDETHFHTSVSCIAGSLKTQIISRSYDEVAICFFNTREKKNLQDLNGVFVFNVAEREHLDRPTARLIKEFDCIEESFMREIGSQYGIVPGSRENSLYNALWVAQALLRKGSIKTADKRILLFTNEDDPFGSLQDAAKKDMTRTTLQRAKDAQDLGISIELLPLSRPDSEFNVSTFYADLIGLDGEDLAQFMPSASQKLEDMKDQLRKRMFTKRVVRRIEFHIANGLSIALNTYALIRPTVPGAITWLDSVTNHPLKIFPDTEEDAPRADEDQIQKAAALIKRIYVKDFSAFQFANPVAYYGASSQPQLVALVAQDEITSAGAQMEPPGMHMIYLPYSDDIRDDEEARTYSLLQRHYAVLQALALAEDDIPETIDETAPDEEGLTRPAVVKAAEAFKLSVYGDSYDEESDMGKEKMSEASRKRKAIAENAAKDYDWGNLADKGQLKNLTVGDLKVYLNAHNLPVSGKKEALISRILTHMGK